MLERFLLLGISGAMMLLAAMAHSLLFILIFFGLATYVAWSE